MKKRSKTAIDLFSGCGGLTLGLRKAGFSVIGAVEIDDLAVETYKKNHRKTRVWHTDIKKCSPRKMRLDLKLKKGELDLLAGCPPCQGFSSMRTLNGGKDIDEPQNDLVFQMIRFVKEFRPKALMMENVPGLAKDYRIEEVNKTLIDLGYKVRYDVLDASDYSVPQRRKRMILVASQSADIPFAEPRTKKVTVRDVLSNMPQAGKSGDELHDLPENRSDKVAKLISLIPKNGGSRMDLPSALQLECHKKCGGFKDVYGRLRWDDVSNTITGGCINPSKGRFIHPQKDRTITLREAAILQSFPKNYYFSLRKGKHHAAQMIGNALPPNFIAAHAAVIAKYL
ncbi:MAG: DNA cytosine methyltransferase [Niastella sp.]|nr:DNA cytosine methyltransferase [Niastella sp.]